MSLSNTARIQQIPTSNTKSDRITPTHHRPHLNPQQSTPNPDQTTQHHQHENNDDTSSTSTSTTPPPSNLTQPTPQLNSLNPDNAESTSPPSSSSDNDSSLSPSPSPSTSEPTNPTTTNAPSRSHSQSQTTNIATTTATTNNTNTIHSRLTNFFSQLAQQQSNPHGSTDEVIEHFYPNTDDDEDEDEGYGEGDEEGDEDDGGSRYVEVELALGVLSEMPPGDDGDGDEVGDGDVRLPGKMGEEESGSERESENEIEGLPALNGNTGGERNGKRKGKRKIEEVG